MRGASDRAGRGGRLLEREPELSAIAGLLTRAREAQGGLLIVEGEPGLGKSRLLSEASGRAAEQGMRVLHACGEELDRAVPWGVARRLLGPAVAAAQASGAPLLGEAAAAAVVFDRSAPAPGGGPGDVLGVAHALLWIVATLAEAEPLLLCVDDAHWADEPSLRMLAYLLSRLAELPVGVLVARRVREPVGERLLLETLTADSRVERIELAALSVHAVEILVDDALGPLSDGRVAAACAVSTRGNPFYLRELLLELSALPADRLSAASVSRLAPESVSRAVSLRLARLEAGSVALAQAVAVLGDDAEFPQAAELAGLDAESAVSAFNRLAEAEILWPQEPLAFVHPLVGQAVAAEIGAGTLGDMHRAAAELLVRDGAAPATVAAHLMQAGRRGDQWVVAALRLAAHSALVQAATETAAEWLARALAEPPASDQRPALLAELGRIEAALGRAQAVERLSAAADSTDEGEARARICADLGRALALQGRSEAAAEAFERGLGCLEDLSSELAKELRAAWWSAATLLAAMRSEAMRVPEPSLPPPGQQPTAGERELLAQHAMQRAFEGEARAAVAELAQRAWGDGELLAERPNDGVTWTLVSGALLLADEVEQGLAVCDAALADARRRGSPMAFATGCYCRAWPLFAQGRVSESVADAQAALAARHDGWSAFLGAAAAVLTLGLIERGEVSQARDALALVDRDPSLRASTQYPMILVAGARLLVAEGDSAAALEQLLRAGEILAAAGLDCASAVPWQADAAIAAGLAGDLEQGRRLADSALAAARRGGAPTAVARALRAAAHCARGPDAIALHRRALDALDGLPARLERNHVLVDLGAALRRGRRRAEARELLREGLELAWAGGALALAQRARVELAAAGARASRDPTARLAALTPSERRVAEMAAGGMTNRAIAQALFVTVKAVEYHLANSYRKLDIERRGELSQALGG